MAFPILHNFFFSPDISFPFSSVQLNAFFLKPETHSCTIFYFGQQFIFIRTLAIYGDMLDTFPIKKSLFKGQIGAICYIRVKFSARYFVSNVSEYPSSVLDIHAL